MRPEHCAILVALLIIPELAMAGSGPRISFDRDTYDYGKVLYGKTVTEEFVFTNTGDSTLVVEKIETGCGCTKGVENSSEVPPNGKSKIRVVFDSTGLRPGRQRQSIFVYSNDHTKPVFKLTLLADVVRELILEPPSLAKKLRNFTDMVTFAVKLTNLSDRICTVTGIENRMGEIKAHLVPQTVVVEPRHTVPFNIQVSLGKEAGQYYHMGRLALLTDHPVEKEIEIRYLIQFEKRK